MEHDGFPTRAGHVLRQGAAACALALLAACGSTPPPAADPASDAPEATWAAAEPFTDAPSYPEALVRWKRAEDINAWIGARFRYDMERALQLSETQRRRQDARLPIHPPEAFFAAPHGVCVDLARFGVEALQGVEPAARPRYLMIEFDPVSVRGHTLRRHWVVVFERGGQHYVFADSKRPGHIAGPYASLQAYIDDYARYRGRGIVAFSERGSYERALRARAARSEAPEQR